MESLPPPTIPDWKQRFAACFRFRHRAMHVFGAPAALGSIIAVAASNVLSADAGLGLGALAAGIGSLLAGYFITAGFDKGLVRQLQEEAENQQAANDAASVHARIAEADLDVQPILQRIVSIYASIEQQFADGIDDQVEAILASSRDDLRLLRDRALAVSKLLQRLRVLLAQTDGLSLRREWDRIQMELGYTPDGPARDALLAAKASTESAFEQFKAAQDKYSQARNLLTVIETNLQEFKLAMELRKADAVMQANQVGKQDVSELQERLAAAGDACDEIMGRKQASKAIQKLRKRRGREV